MIWTLQWRHNERDGVPNHQPCDCLLNRLLNPDADQRKHVSSASLVFVRKIHRWPMNSPHKWPGTRKCFHLMTSAWFWTAAQRWHLLDGGKYYNRICCACKTVEEEAHTVYPKKYAHGFVVLCFVVVMQSFIMNSHEVFIHIHQGCFAGTGAIVRLPQWQWSKPDGYGKISQCITTTKHSKAKTVCIFLGIYCIVLQNVVY